MSQGRAHWIWAQWRRHLWWLAVMAVFTVASSGATLFYPLAMREVVDRIHAAARRQAELQPSSAFLALGVLLLLRLVAGMYPAFRAWMNFRFEWDIRDASLTRILRKDHRFFLTFPTGDVVTRLTDDLREYPKLAWFLSSGIFRGVDALARFVFSLGAIVVLDWRVALVALLPLPLGVYLYYLLRHRLHRAFEEQQRAISATNEALEASFSGIRIVKAFTAESGQERKLASVLQSRVKIQYRLARLFALAWYGDVGMGKICQGIALLAAGALVLKGSLTLGSMYAIYLYLERLMQPLTELPGLPAVARQAFVSMDRIRQLDQFPQRRHKTTPLGGEFRELVFDHVWLAYGEAEPLLQDITLRVGRGEWVALVGPVGCGKTTVLKLACGVLEPTGGRVLLNGVDVSRVREEDVASLVAWVPQEGGIFSASVGDNVRVGRPLGDEWVWRCLEASRVRQDVEQMGGLGSRLGHRGSLVSGGQRQRLAIARALAGRPGLLLLDDPTANLDAKTEEELWEWLSRWGVSILVATHRWATVRRMQRVIVLRAGRVHAMGKPEALLSRDGFFRALMGHAPTPLTPTSSADRLGA